MSVIKTCLSSKTCDKFYIIYSDFCVFTSVNLSLGRDRFFPSDDDRKLAICVPSEKLFLDRRAWERRTGIESYGTSHVSYANSRHPEITPVHQMERGVHDRGSAPAIARWRCSELIISACQSREYKQRGRRIHISESNRRVDFRN